ncbi:MAG: hypothetical protein AB8F95_22560 [Bacteroidia bacterium]
MTISQRIDAIPSGNNIFDTEITVTDVPSKHFLAITGNSISEGSTTREIIVEVMPLEQAPGGTIYLSSNVINRASGESAIKVTVSQNGQTLGTNTTNYSS